VVTRIITTTFRSLNVSVKLFVLNKAVAIHAYQRSSIDYKASDSVFSFVYEDL